MNGREIGDVETLGEVLAEQVRICRDILRTTQATVGALEAGDVDALEGSIAKLSVALSRLGEVETHAERLRGPDFSPPAELAPALSELRDVAARIRGAEVQLREEGEKATHALREKIRGMQAGQQALRRYGRSGATLPRFANRKG